MALVALPESLNRRLAPATWIKEPTELSLKLQKARSLAEVKVVLYVLHHTYGYHEYNTAKHLTLDEFQYGRKRRDGTRMDEGTGLPRSSLKIGIKQAVEDGLLYEIVDAHDLGRIAKYYAVRLPSDDIEPVEESTVPDFHGSGRGSESDPGGLDSDPGGSGIGPGGSEINPRGAGVDPRSEKDTLERNFRKKQKKDTGAFGAEALREKKKKKEESNEPSGQQDTPAPTSEAAKSELAAYSEEDEEAQAERLAREAQRARLLAEIQATRETANNYGLSSTERLRAKQLLRTLEWIWRKEFPGEAAG